MSIQSDIVTALSAVASGDVYPQAAPEDVDLPFVIYRVLNKDTLQMIDGTLDQTNSLIVFECWADDYSEALTLSDSVKTAIEGSALTWYRESAPGEEYSPPVDAYMEPVYYGFWHN